MGPKNAGSYADLAIRVINQKAKSVEWNQEDYGGDIGMTFLIFGCKVSLNLLISLTSITLYIP